MIPRFGGCIGISVVGATWKIHPSSHFRSRPSNWGFRAAFGSGFTLIIGKCDHSFVFNSRSRGTVLSRGTLLMPSPAVDFSVDLDLDFRLIIHAIEWQKAVINFQRQGGQGG